MLLSDRLFGWASFHPVRQKVNISVKTKPVWATSDSANVYALKASKRGKEFRSNQKRVHFLFFIFNQIWLKSKINHFLDLVFVITQLAGNEDLATSSPQYEFVLEGRGRNWNHFRPNEQQGLKLFFKRWQHTHEKSSFPQIFKSNRKWLKNDRKWLPDHICGLSEREKEIKTCNFCSLRKTTIGRNCFKLSDRNDNLSDLVQRTKQAASQPTNETEEYFRVTMA